MPDLGIGEATLIAGLIGGGATATAGVIGASKSAGAAKDAAATQSDAAVKAAQIQADSADRQSQLQAATAKQALDYSRSQSQLSLDQYNQQQQRLQPYRNLGAFALGQPLSGAPAPLSLPPLPSSGTTASSGMMPSGQSGMSADGDPAAFALSLVSKGVSPDQAAQQTNQKFNLQTGSQAVYYPDSNTIGLPNAYLAGPTNKPDSPSAWGIVPRAGGGGGGSAATAATAGPVKLNYTPTVMQNYAGPQTTIGTLTPPPIQRPTLGQIGGVF